MMSMSNIMAKRVKSSFGTACCFGLKRVTTSISALLVDGIFATRFLRRVEYGVRQGVAVGIACVWVLVPTTASPFSRVAFLAAVLAMISCNENFGRTLRSACLSMMAAIAGALLVVAWHEAVGTSYGASWGGVALLSFVLTYPRFDPLALKIAQVLNVSSLITFHITPTLPWYFPFQTAAACGAGCGSALLALLLPFPRAASSEAKTRVATSAKVSTATFSSLVESYTALSDERGQFMQLQGSYLLQSSDLNLTWFQAVLPDLQWEPWVRAQWRGQVTAYVKLVKELTACLRGMHRAVNDWDLQHAAHNPLKSKMAASLRRVGVCTGYSLGHQAAVLQGLPCDPPEVVAAGEASFLNDAVLTEFLHDLQLAREYAYYREPYLEAGRVMFPNAPLWGMLASSFFLFHVYHYACTLHKAQGTLVQLAASKRGVGSSGGGDSEGQGRDASAEDEEAESGSEEKEAEEGHRAHSKAEAAAKALWSWMVSWWGPDKDKWKEAVRRTAALVSAGIVGLALSPYGLWAAIAAAFVGGQRIGGSFNTAANRLQGSVAGAVAGFLLLLAAQKIPAVIGVLLSVWVAVSGYVRTNPAVGYGGLVGGFTAIVIMLGQQPDIPRITLETYAFTRLYEQCIGILFVVLFDYALWPARAVKLIRQETIANLTRCRTLWSLLMTRYLDASTLEHRHAAVAQILGLEAATTASVAKQRQLAKEAAGEPQLWHAPFPEGPWKTLIAGQESAVRLMGTVRRTMTVRSSEVLAEQMDVLVHPLRQQLELLGQEIQATLTGLLASLGGAPESPRDSHATEKDHRPLWLARLLRCLPGHLHSEQPSKDKQPQRNDGGSARGGERRNESGDTPQAVPNGLPTSLSALSSASSLEQGSRISDVSSLEHDSPAAGSLGPEAVRTWSMPHLVVNVAALSGAVGVEGRAMLGHLRQGGAPQGTRSEGNTPRPQGGKRALASCSQRVIDEISSRIAAVEREEEARAERQRERRASLDRRSMDANGAGRPAATTTRLGSGQPQTSPAVRTPVPGGAVGAETQHPAGASNHGDSRNPSWHGSSSDSQHGRQNEAWNEVSIQGGAILDAGQHAVVAAVRTGAVPDREQQHAGTGLTREGAAKGEAGGDADAEASGGVSVSVSAGRLPAPASHAPSADETSSSASEDDEDEGAPDLMVGPTLRERRARALAGLQRRYEAVIQGLVAAKRAEPTTPLLSSEALLHFNTLMYTMRLLIHEAEKMEAAIREVRQMSRPIRLGTIAQMPYDVAVKREAAYDQDPISILLGPGPTPSALWHHRIKEEANEGNLE